MKYRTPAPEFNELIYDRFGYASSWKLEKMIKLIANLFFKLAVNEGL